MNKKGLADTLLLIKENLVDKQPDKAIDLLEKICAKHPRSAEAYGLLSDAYHQIRNFEQAINNSLNSLLIEPDNLKNRIRLLILTPIHGTEKTIKKIEKAMEIIPECIYLYKAKGLYLRHQNLFEEAISCYSKGIENMPNAVVLYYSRAELYTKIGRTENAISDYEIGLKIDQGLSGNYYNYLTVAGLYLANKNFNQALVHLKSLFLIEKKDEVEPFEDIYFPFEKEDIVKYLKICKSHLTQHPEDRAAEYCYHLIDIIFKSIKWDWKEQKVIENETYQ